MSDRLRWLVVALRPHRGWAAFLLAFSACMCVPAAFGAAARSYGSAKAVRSLDSVATLLALLCGLSMLLAYGLARSRLTHRVAVLLSVLAGFGLVAAIGGQLVPSPTLVWLDAGASIRLLTRSSSSSPGSLPFTVLAVDIWQRLTGLGQRLWWDVYGLLRGASFWETQLYLLLAGLAVWVVAFTATWATYRRTSVLAGSLPGGAALCMLVLYHPPSATYLLGFLFCILWLQAMSQLWKRWDSWHETGIDHPDGLGAELLLAIGPAIIALTLLAVFVPTSGFHRVSNLFWRQTEKSLGPIAGTMTDETINGTLPRTHLLDGRPELGDEIVFYVKLHEIRGLPSSAPASGELIGPQLPGPYWRQQTYDVYTGRGWSSSTLDSQVLSKWQPMDACCDGDAELEQQYEIVSSDNEFVVAANSPWRIDQAVTVWWRAPGDLAWISGEESQYTVISRIPGIGMDDLRVSPTVPAEVALRYLILPESVPQRVRDLADGVTAGAETLADKALAIEAFMRTYSYTLHLPDPPQNRDLVDYFLYELQAGYCDYYASAMVVLARAAGIPARLASGYIGGTYDPQTERWTVTEKDAHSWVEVFFSGVGWVEFEPTAGQPAPLHYSNTGRDPLDVPPLPKRAIPWRRYAAPLLLGLLTAAALIGQFLHRRGSPEGPPGQPTRWASDHFARLQVWGRRLGVRPDLALTSWEYGDLFRTQLCHRARSSRLRNVRDSLPDALLNAERIVDAHVLAHYSQRRDADQPAALLSQSWRQLRRWLLWLQVDRLVSTFLPAVTDDDQ